MNQKLEAFLLGLVALVALLVMDAYVRDSPTPQNDELIYHRMASEPFETHTFVFAYRVAVPTLVHVMPFGHGFSFSLLAWLFTAGCASLTYLLLRRFEISKPFAAGLGFAFALCPTLFVASLRQGANVDPESVFVMLAGAIAIVDRRPLALGVIVLVGALVRESTLFLVPFAYAVWAPFAARNRRVRCAAAVASHRGQRADHRVRLVHRRAARRAARGGRGPAVPAAARGARVRTALAGGAVRAS